MKHKESRIDAPLGGAESNAPKKKGKRVWWISICAVLVIAAALYAVFGLILPARREADQLKAENARLEALYTQAVQLNKNGEYMQAYTAFTELGAYKDSAQQAQVQLEAQYALAVQLQEDGKYIDAHATFEPLGDYKDCAQQREYTAALIMEYSGDIYRAATAFYTLGDYRDSWQRCFTLWGELTTREVISSDYKFGLAIKDSGKPHGISISSPKEGNNIVAISAHEEVALGLHDNGKVECLNRYNIIPEVAKWTDIVAISAGDRHFVGLKADGTVIAVGENNFEQCNVDDWKDIVDISAGYKYTIGLKADGTVMTTRFPRSDVYLWRVQQWENIIAVSAGYLHAVGLKADGTVVATGDNTNCACMVSEWKDIVAVSAGTTHTVGLKADGTVVAAGYNEHGECNVTEWTDIVAISAGEYCTIGLKRDGTVVGTGENQLRYSTVLSWTDLKLPQKIDAEPTPEKEPVVLNQVGDRLYVADSKVEVTSYGALQTYALNDESILRVEMMDDKLFVATDANRLLLISPKDGTIVNAVQSLDDLTGVDWENCCVTEETLTYYNKNKREIVIANAQLEEIRRIRLGYDIASCGPRFNPATGEIYYIREYTQWKNELWAHDPYTNEVRRIHCDTPPTELIRCTSDGKTLGYYGYEANLANLGLTCLISTETGELLSNKPYVMELYTYGEWFYANITDISYQWTYQGHHETNETRLFGKRDYVDTVVQRLHLEKYYYTDGYTDVHGTPLFGMDELESILLGYPHGYPSGGVFVTSTQEGFMRLSFHRFCYGTMVGHVSILMPEDTPQAITDGRYVWIVMREQGQEHAALYRWDPRWANNGSALKYTIPY